MENQTLHVGDENPIITPVSADFISVATHPHLVSLPSPPIPARLCFHSHFIPFFTAIDTIWLLFNEEYIINLDYIISQLLIIQFVSVKSEQTSFSSLKTIFILSGRLWISQPGLYGSAGNFPWRFGHISERFSAFWADNSRDGWIIGVNRRHVTKYACCWSTCCCYRCSLKVK